MAEEYKYSCDVLVVGGGIAAFFAAIKAREQGVSVILVDKGFAGKSGQSPHAECFMVYHPEWGHDLDVCMEEISRIGEYVNNRYWTQLVLEESYARFQDLISYGCSFKKYENGDYLDEALPVVTGQYKTIPFDMELGGYLDVLRKKALSLGIRIIDRVMIVELMKQKGRIAGAAGISVESYDLYFFTAKATILCVGACGFKPIGYPPLMILTGDGEAMTYRAGGEVLGKEFVDVHQTMDGEPDRKGQRCYPTGSQPTPPRKYNLDENGTCVLDPTRKNALGQLVGARPKGASLYGSSYLFTEFEIHAGRGPVTSKGRELYGGAALGMSIRKADGIWPADRNCSSSLPGLYAAGDSLGNMQNGSLYSSLGSSTTGGAVTGTVAGIAAAGEARNMPALEIEEDEMERAKKFVYGPKERVGGYSPRWVIELVQNLMRPYFVSYIKKEDRLLACITLITFIRGHLVPGLYARDPHELRLAHEAANLALSAEMRLRSALFRTESRGNHYREDYPCRDDENWLAWTKIKQVDGEMQLIKVPIPEEWRPDASLTYRQKYPVRFPGEEETGL